MSSVKMVSLKVAQDSDSDSRSLKSFFSANSQGSPTDCPICLEPYDPARVKVSVGLCQHYICKPCFEILTEDKESMSPSYPDWPLCPYCCAPMRHGRQLLFLRDHLFPHRKGLEVNSDGLTYFRGSTWTTIRMTTTVLTRQFNKDSFYTDMIHEVSRSTRRKSDNAEENRGAPVVNCTEAEFDTQELRVREKLDQEFRKHLDDTAASKMHKERSIHFLCEPFIDETKSFETWLHRTLWLNRQRRKGFETSEVLLYTTRVYESILPYRVERSFQRSTAADWEIKFLTFIRIQMTIAVSRPELKNFSELNVFFQNRRANCAATKIVDSPRGEHHWRTYWQFSYGLGLLWIIYTLAKHYTLMPLDIYRARGQSSLFRTLLAMKHEYGYWLSPYWFTPDSERFIDRVEQPLLAPEVDRPAELLAPDEDQPLLAAD
ncbi:RING/U-box [Glarea lozoyensis ATCC 20868]|uniref:RING/U-box n=1 Tax=Glarea lozoyensis (strain ATCC 20868 / MF5171) TaxID=1116229 RepID=S3DU83_GLAL2|nr:RING/U-box [Glarea lozoyensis ATCC 20868]EPE29978.1 RING/U-box [Glarea lozoyensis ATCC 20868]